LWSIPFFIKFKYFLCYLYLSYIKIQIKMSYLIMKNIIIKEMRKVLPRCNSLQNVLEICIEWLISNEKEWDLELIVS
jgi:hypothetical protein